MNTMWRVGCPYYGGSAKINPDDYNGDWQDSKKRNDAVRFRSLCGRYSGKLK
ncbi:hypothetical protein OAM03_01765 [Verrucomicrobia bacterium]|nr:hypothetical protein [Verrucomicrobiota bacterium]